MASESSQSSSPSPSPPPSSSPSPSLGDTFVGSFISLISKSEIRYEGTLYHLNVQDSTLGLKNVRSCGTEGRKKDGSQIPPSDSVYNYILFRGSDIKDLQVNPSPSTQPRQEIQSEQVINQSSHSKPAISSPPSGYENGYGLGRGAQWVPTPALSSKQFTTTQNLPVPLGFTPPSTNVGSFTESPVSLIGSTQSNVSMPMPSFMQGNKLAPTGVPLGMMQQSVSSHSTMHNDPKMVVDFDSPIMGVVDDTSQVVTRPTDLASNPSYLNPSLLGQARLHSPTGLVASSPSNLSPLSEPQLSAPHIQNSYPIAPQAVGKDFYDSRSTHPNRMPYELPAVTSDSAPVNFGPPKSFFGMDPVMQSRQQMVNRGQQMYATTNPVSVDGPSRNLGTANHAPLLPLPVATHQSRFPSSGIEFTEEFDFEAMNERFNKSEVWGLLGKNNQRSQNDYREETAVELNGESKANPAYKKDDFFDTISCNQLDRVARSGQQQQQQHIQFPNHMSQVPEAFGIHFQRPPPPQPGQGAYLATQTNYRGGHNHGGYNHGGYNHNNNYSNQGYGNYYGGRGRGRNTHF